MKFSRTYTLFFTASLFSLGGACATTPKAAPLAAAPRAPEPAVQQAQAMQDNEPTAAMLLKQAFMFFGQGENAMAVSLFKGALATGDLNDAGRALAYWHLYLAEQTMGHQNAAAEHLMAFTVVAQDVIDTQIRDVGMGQSDFVDRFDLRNRLSRARAVISASWSKQAELFGRSPMQPVVIRDTTEKNFFLELVTPCNEQHVESTMPKADVEEVKVTCAGESYARTYFFTVVGAKARLP